MRGALVSLILALAITQVACGGEDSQLTTHVAPGFDRSAPHPISVFGVFRDGRMSTKTWDDFSPRLDVLGLEPCGAAYDVDFVSSQGALAQAIDEYARSYGLTDTLLASVGAAAKTDLILVFVVSGAIPSKHTSTEPPPQPRPAPSPGMGRGPRTSYSARAAERRELGALEISASLFSMKRHETVAAVTIRYTGRHEDDAIAQMNTKLKDLFASASCAGWDFAAHPVDADAVKALPED
jgi:hypothetical protein